MVFGEGKKIILNIFNYILSNRKWKIIIIKNFFYIKLLIIFDFFLFLKRENKSSYSLVGKIFIGIELLIKMKFFLI